MAERDISQVGGMQLTRARIAVVIGVAVVVAVVVWLLASGDNDEPAKRAVPKTASKQQLVALSSKLGHPVYWAGPESATTYELTQTSGGSVYVRYLPAGTRL